MGGEWSEGKSAVVLLPHHTAFGVFSIKGSGRGHVIINGNLRETERETEGAAL